MLIFGCVATVNLKILLKQNTRLFQSVWKPHFITACFRNLSQCNETL